MNPIESSLLQLLVELAEEMKEAIITYDLPKVITKEYYYNSYVISQLRKIDDITTDIAQINAALKCLEEGIRFKLSDQIIDRLSYEARKAIKK